MELTQLPLLAEPADFADRRGVAVDLNDPQALQFLADASAFFRSYTGQVITEVLDDEQELFGVWDDTLRLPQLPVIEMSDVAIRFRGEDDTTAMDDWTVTRRGRLRRPGGWGGPEAIIDVIYSHGFAVVPDDVRRCVLSIAHRIISNPNDVIGETIGSYEVVYAQQAASGKTPVGLSVREQFVLDKYRAWAS